MNTPIPDDPFAYHEFEIRRLEKELEAARVVVDFADKFRKFSAHALPTCYSKSSCECWHDALAQSIARYDEARQK